MIDGQRDVGAGSDLDGISSLFFHNDEAFLELADAQDGRLGLFDDGRGDEAAADAVVGEGERSALYVFG